MASHHRLFSTEEKTKIVLRVLKGENIHAVATELDVSVERLAHWESRFLEGGREALGKSTQRALPRYFWHWVGLIVVLILTVALLSVLSRPGPEP